jgi:inorganic pyrophosphatase
LAKNNHARHAVLSELPAFDSEGDLRVVIETPKGSQNKYKYDPQCDCLELKTSLPAGMSFPYDFGFIPSTLGQDGDPVDVLVLMDTAVIAGCVITARAIGIIEAEQKEEGKDWERNDRVLAVAVHSRSHAKTKIIKDLRPHLMDEITAFFVDYNELHGKKFKPLGTHGPGNALDHIEEGCRAYKSKRKKKK